MANPLRQKASWVGTIGLYTPCPHIVNGTVCMWYMRLREKDRSHENGSQLCLQLQCTNPGRSFFVLLTYGVISKGTFQRFLNQFVTKYRGNFQ